MAAIKGFIAALLLTLACPAAAQVDGWTEQISEASARFGIPADWIRQVMKLESDGKAERLGRPIVSRAGAMGLMQLMPGTFADMRAAYGLGSDPFDPHDNIMAGAAYLRAMYNRFGYPGLFAAYNAGPDRYRHHLAMGERLPLETRAYVARLAGVIPAVGRDRQSKPALFALSPVPTDRRPLQLPLISSQSIFAVRR